MAPAQERAGRTREVLWWGVCALWSGLWPGRGDGRGIPGDPGQFEAAGECAAVKGLPSVVCVVCPPMYGMLDGPGECAIGLGWGFRGDDGMRPPLGDGCGM